jgi:polysaccharide biosynthesis protein PslE
MREAELTGIPSIHEIATLVSMHKAKLVSAFVIPLLLAFALFLIVAPVYQAETSLVVKNGREYLAPDDGRSSSAPETTKEAGINSELELLASRAVISETITQSGIDFLYPDLRPGYTGTLMDAAVDRFRNDLAVASVKMSNVIDLGFKGKDAEKTSKVLDKLVRVYQDKHAEVFSGSRADVYRQIMARDFEEVNNLEQQRTKIKVDNGIFDIAQQRMALINQQVAVRTRLEEQTSKRNTLQKRVAYLQSSRPDIPAMTVSNVTDKNDEMVHVRDTLTDLLATEASLSARYGAKHPGVQRVRDQITTMRQRVARIGDQTTRTTTQPSQLALRVQQELVMDQAELSPLAGEVQRSSELLASIGNDLQRMEAADTNLRTTETRLEELKNTLKVVRGRFNQARTEELMDDAKLVSVVQIAPAMTSHKPIFPRLTRFIAFGTLAGVFSVGCVLVFAIFSNGTLVTEENVERVLGLPVLVSIPLLARQRQPLALPRE